MKKQIFLLLICFCLLGCKADEGTRKVAGYPHLEEIQEVINIKSDELEIAENQLRTETEHAIATLAKRYGIWYLILRNNSMSFDAIYLPLENWEELRDKVDGLIKINTIEK